LEKNAVEEKLLKNAVEKSCCAQEALVANSRQVLRLA
jgi:hypothetical protein